MTTHLKARAAQAGVLLALTVGVVAVAPMAALAAGAQPGLTVTGVNPNNVLSGGKVTLNYRVTNNNGGLGGGNDQDDNAKVEFGLPAGTQCGDCGQQSEVQPGSQQNFSAHLTMPQVQPGQTQRFTVNITVTIADASNRTQAQITVQGADKPQSVTAITGKVKDTNGKGVAGAVVGAQDSTGATFSSSTNGAGSFSILATDSKPIAPGTIQVGAGKDGFEDGAHVQVQGSAGKTVTVSLTLKAIQASASASPSASASASAASSIDPGSVLSTDEAGPQVNLPSDAAKNASQDSGSGSMLFVVLGGLLVAAGVGAIVLVLMRRKNANKGIDGGGDDPTAMGGGPGVVPPSQGRYNDATRVGSPMGAGPAAATMVAPRSGAPSMADAPTMLHRPVPSVEDEFPDPYGAPLPQQGGYAGAAAGGWDNQAGAGQYGPPNQYGQPEDDYAGAGQYGAAAGAGQYGGAAPERFDEHTSLYRPESEQDGYGDYDQGGYAGAAGGGQYGAGGGTYGGAGAAGDEYGAAAGGQYGGGAYGAGRPDDDYRAGGGGYQSGAAGYGQEPADQGGYGSWGAPADGIDSGNGYGQQGGQRGGQYGGGAYGGAGDAGAAAGGGAAGGGAAYGGGQYGGAGGAYDDRGGYDPGYEQPGAAGYGAGNEYGRGNARPPQQGGARPPQQGGYGYDQYEEQDSGAHGRRGYDEQQPSRRGGGRRPSDY